MKTILFTSLACLFVLSGCITDQEMVAMDNRITALELRDAELRKESDTLSTRVQDYERTDQNIRQQAASLRAMLENLREEVRALNGKIEEIDHLVKQQGKTTGNLDEQTESQLNRIADLTNANNERIIRIEQYLNLESSDKIASKIKPEKQVEKQLPEDEMYRMAKEAFDQGDSETARKRFQELLKRYPNSENADNAHFWIGEIYYREKWYEKAILEYQEVIENYPNGNKVPASLLKQGFAFLKLDDKASARLVLDELIKKFPDAQEAKVAKDTLKDL